MNAAAVPAPRLEAVLHYVIARTAGAGFGRVKINKAVVAADREFFRRFGRTITGATSFQKQRLGPVPNGVLKSLKSLRDKGLISDHTALTPVGSREEHLSHQEPDLRGFSAAEIDVINLAIFSLARLSAQEASDQTHDALWDEVDLMDQIPVAASAFQPGQIDEDTLAWALR
jgi:hypothetical protein